MKDARTRHPALKSRLLSLLRIIVSVGLIAWLVFSVDWPTVGRALLGADLALLLFSGLLYYIGIALSCLKWQLILRVEGIEIQLGRLLRWYLIGAFASNFLPTDIGGDLGRGVLAGRHSGRPLAVLRSILVERLSGLIFMLLLGWAGALILLPGPRRLIILASLIALVVALSLWALWYKIGPGLVQRLLDRLPDRLRTKIAESVAVGHEFVRRPGILTAVLLLSLLFQLLAGFGFWIDLLAVRVGLPAVPAMLAWSLVAVIGLLPISVNGWGVRETVLIGLLVVPGAQSGGVFAAALLARAVVLLLSLPGAALLAMEGRRGLRPAP